jgi:enhancer of polycomb-like protein
MLFTKALVPDKLAAAGIIPPSDARSGRARFQGRMGRGGRIVFDRWNPLNQAHINCGNTLYIAP